MRFKGSEFPKRPAPGIPLEEPRRHATTMSRGDVTQSPKAQSLTNFGYFGDVFTTSGFPTHLSTSQQRKHGRGIMVYSDRTVYEGDWIDDERHGNGICLFPSGNVYVGQFSHGHMEGFGSMFYKDGDFFSGSFSQSACHGAGVYYSGGVEMRGEWRNGVRVTVQRSPVTTIEDFDAQRLHYETFFMVLRQLHGHFAFYSRFDNRFKASTETSSGLVEPSARVENLDPHMQHTATAATHMRTQSEDVFTANPKFAALIEVPESSEISNRDEESLTWAKDPLRLTEAADESSQTIEMQQGQSKSGKQARRRSAFEPLSPARNAAAPPLEPMQMNPSPSRLPFVATEANTVAAAVTVGRETSSRYARTSSPTLLFACGGPMTNEHFSIFEYLRHAALFLLPILSIPHIPICPLQFSGLDTEREYVVSGAALSQDFRPPKASVYIALIGFVVQAIVVVIASTKTSMTSRMEKKSVLAVEVIGPAVLWFVFAFICAGYHGFPRVAHALERLDRHLAPRIAAFAANVIDANAEICVFTWDEEGRSKITNNHYKFRWVFFSITVGLCTAFATPVTRAAFGQVSFLREPLERVVVSLVVISFFFFVSGITYFVLKVTDMQRQILSQLSVMSRLAYLDGVSITAPSEHRRVKFDFDGPLDVTEFFQGYSGWYITRSFVLGSSACANHLARSAAMSSFVIAEAILCFVIIGDIVYAGASGQLNNDDGTYFTAAHSVAMVLVASWGALSIRYLYSCVATRVESRRHLNIMDVTAMYHSAARGDDHAAHVVELTRQLTEKHDPLPTIGSVEVTPGILLAVTTLNVLAFAALWIIFADAFSFGWQ